MLYFKRNLNQLEEYQMNKFIRLDWNRLLVIRIIVTWSYMFGCWDVDEILWSKRLMCEMENNQ